MISLHFNGHAERPLQVLCLGCHADDIEIGCGGAVLRFAKEHPSCSFRWVVFTGDGVRRAEALRASELFAGGRLRGEPLLKSFPDGFLPFHGAEVKTIFEELKREISPDLIFTHSR
jgi:LmbE family N-acetylglucosaminyl deacetylase